MMRGDGAMGGLEDRFCDIKGDLFACQHLAQSDIVRQARLAKHLSELAKYDEPNGKLRAFFNEAQNRLRCRIDENNARKKEEANELDSIYPSLRVYIEAASQNKGHGAAPG